MVIYAPQLELMKCSLLIRCITPISVYNPDDPPVSLIAFDSRMVRPGACFVAISGLKSNGNDYVQQAIDAGASVIVSEERSTRRDVSWIQVGNAREALGELSSCFYDYPSSKIKVIGITGTNGKTTTSWMVHHLLERKGRTTGLLGTIEHRIGGRVLPAKQTTPSSLECNVMLNQMLKAGCSHAVMEVSSHAVDQYRVAALEFDRLVFTNLSQDHLDYHPSMEAYYQAKKKLFLDAWDQGVKPDRIIVVEDEWGSRLAEDLRALGVDVITVGESAASTLQILHVETRGLRSRAEIRSPWGTANLSIPLPGTHNIYNACCALASVMEEGDDIEQPCSSLSGLPSIPGRLEQVPNEQRKQIIIDYAHTPDALEHVLQILHAEAEGELWVVFGCGGDRDSGKRPLMGAVAAAHASKIILTNDNPRSENPDQIIQDIRDGIQPGAVEVLEIPDRYAAIEHAVLHSKPHDILLIAGKGHESRQELKHTIIPFSDRECVEALLKGSAW